jgi:hypothetical protein
MYDDHHLSFSPTRDFLCKSLYSFDVDNSIETMAVNDLVSKRLNLQRLLASDIYCRSTIYKPIRSWPISTRYRSLNTSRSYVPRPILPRPISTVELPRITIDPYRPSFYSKNCHRYDSSYLNVSNREPSFFPLAQNSYRLQNDY